MSFNVVPRGEDRERKQKEGLSILWARLCEVHFSMASDLKFLVGITHFRFPMPPQRSMPATTSHVPACTPPPNCVWWLLVSKLEIRREGSIYTAEVGAGYKSELLPQLPPLKSQITRTYNDPYCWRNGGSESQGRTPAVRAADAPAFLTAQRFLFILNVFLTTVVFQSWDICYLPHLKT